MERLVEALLAVVFHAPIHAVGYIGDVDVENELLLVGEFVKLFVA